MTTRVANLSSTRSMSGPCLAPSDPDQAGEFMKSQVLEAIGETDLKHPIQVNAALAANDRLKYYFSLLQMAIAHAEPPQQQSSTLRRERLSCGIDVPLAENRAEASW